jgi:hypothetical protein
MGPYSRETLGIEKDFHGIPEIYGDNRPELIEPVLPLERVAT